MRFQGAGAAVFFFDRLHNQTERSAVTTTATRLVTCPNQKGPILTSHRSHSRTIWARHTSPKRMLETRKPTIGDLIYAILSLDSYSMGGHLAPP